MDRARKRELRDLNNRVWNGEREIFQVDDTLDSSLKKNTAFIKRLRTAISATTTQAFLQEIRSLSLHKYLSEIISASYDGLCKLKTPTDIAAGVEIVSALHQRFGPEEFTGYLGWFLGRGLATPEKAALRALGADAKEKEEKERLARHRVLLKVVTELWLVGVLRSLDDARRPDETARKDNIGGANGKSNDPAKSKSGLSLQRHENGTEAEPFPLEVLKDLLGHDRDHSNLPLVVLFVKSFGWEILGAKPNSGEGRKSVEEDGAVTLGLTDDLEDGGITLIENDQPITLPALQQRFRNILARYFEDVKTHLIRDQKNIASQARRNAEAYVKSGEVFEDRQASHEKQIKVQEKLFTNAQILCDVLGQEMPDLKDDDISNSLGKSGIGLVRAGDYLRGQGEGAGIWEDEEERRFYENLIDLKERVPGILLEDTKKKKLDNEEQVGRKADAKAEQTVDDDNKSSVDSSIISSTVPDPKASDLEDQSIAIANKTVAAQVDALIARLPELNSKESIDEAAIDFCFLNSKASRNRLIRAVQEVPKGRSDLLPSYSRLVATLGKYMLDIPQALISYLDAEFRSLQRRKEKGFLGQVRTSNIRYLAELTKFGVVPEHVIFHCLRVSLDDFSRMNIEIISNLLESCGRFLLRNPETSPRMVSFLETLVRKKTAQHIGQQERMLIENAVYYVDPPKRAAIQQKERTPMELYIRKLIYLDMHKKNYAKVLKMIRKLHWEEKEVVTILTKIFTKPGKVKYSNIHLMAILMGALYRYHQDFVISVIDDLLESITVGLEHNNFKFNQRRIAEVKYLGELYNYKMVDSPVIFDTLYRVVTFGHAGGTPRPGAICPLDMPDDFFRIRLVCSLLDTCGMCFDRGSSRKKLDFFLTFFQYYIFTKETMPMDVDFMVQDTYSATRPLWKIASNLDEAGQAFASAVSQNYKAQEVEKQMEVEEADDVSSSSDDIDGDDARLPDIGEQSSGEDVDTHLSGEAPNTDDEFGDEQITVIRQKDQDDPEADEEFDRELAKMMSESLDSRKFERKQFFDAPLPMKTPRAHRDISIAVAEEQPNGTPRDPPTTMAFSLLTKRGNRQQTRTVELPANSNFAMSMKTQQEAERAEHQRIKSLVLNYDLTEADSAEGDTLHNAPTSSLNTKGFKGPERHNSSHARGDRAGTSRHNQRTRKLQLSDVDWYAKHIH
ncbi:MAG: hypothetical protein M1829_005489 [Trizodia sp. TS-e1964]|nr:MAG: hypothetical protein M1829_005489 [Trizodia sp. TS-e1964]